VHAIVQTARASDGSRGVVEIAELAPSEQGYALRLLYRAPAPEPVT
jgi:hypothetical protein